MKVALIGYGKMGKAIHEGTNEKMKKQENNHRYYFNC